MSNVSPTLRHWVDWEAEFISDSSFNRINKILDIEIVDLYEASRLNDEEGTVITDDSIMMEKHPNVLRYCALANGYAVGFEIDIMNKKYIYHVERHDDLFNKEEVV